MKFRTDLSRVKGLGSSKDGTHHWWYQRLTAIALLPLTILFLIPFIRAFGSDHGEFIAIYSHIGNAIIAILFFIVACTHLRMGLQVVIEDYSHSKGWKTVLLVSNWLFCWGLMIAATFAILRISLSFVI